MKLSDILSIIFVLLGIFMILYNPIDSFDILMGAIDIVIGIIGFIAGRKKMII